jgi:hypothetical protein
MQGCYPHRESPSSPRELAAGILGAKSFQERVLRSLGIGTPAVPANCSFAVATVLRNTRSSNTAVRAAICDWTGFWVGGHVAYGAGSIDESSSHFKILVKNRSQKLIEQVANSRRARSLGSALCRIPRLRVRASMKITQLTPTNIRPPADYVVIPQSASLALSKS